MRHIGVAFLALAALCAVGVVVDGDVVPETASRFCRPRTAYCAAPHDLVPMILVIVFSTIGAIFAIVGQLASRNERLLRQLHERGERATATIVAARTTSSRVGANAVYALELDVDTPRHGRQRVSRRVVVPVGNAPHVQPGATLQAWTDPAREGRVAIDPSTISRPAVNAHQMGERRP